MAINKVEYDGNTLMDITDTTATAGDVASGKVFYGANGVRTTGTSSGGGGSATDVQINGTSIVDNDIANIITKSEYNASTNKITTESDLEDKQNKLGKVALKLTFTNEMIHEDSTTVKNAIINAYVSPASTEQMQLVPLITAENKLYVNSHDYLFYKIAPEPGETDGAYILINNLKPIETPDVEDYELGMERIDTTKPCFFVILTPNQEAETGYLIIAGSTETVLNQTWKFIQEQEISYISDVGVSGEYNDLIGAPSIADIEQKHAYSYGGTTYYYQFYGVSSLDGITVNIGFDVDVVLATLVLINQSVPELQESYSQTLYAIQNIHVPDTVYQEPVLIINIHNVGCMTCYLNTNTKYVTQAIFTNFAQGYSVNFGVNQSQLTVYYQALNAQYYLAKDNTTAYTPSGDYNPATKKYVDDRTEITSYTISNLPERTGATHSYELKKIGNLVVLDVVNIWMNSLSSNTWTQIGEIPSSIRPNRTINSAGIVVRGDNGEVQGYVKCEVRYDNGYINIRSNTAVSVLPGVCFSCSWILD